MKIGTGHRTVSTRTGVSWGVRVIAGVLAVWWVGGVAGQTKGVTATSQPSETARSSPSRTLLRVSPEEFARVEAQFSPELRGIRARYRRLRTIRDPDRLKRVMRDLAAEVQGLLPTRDRSELPQWLKLQEDAYVVMGDMKRALQVLKRRYDRLKETVGVDAAVEQAFREALSALGHREYPRAVAMYQRADTLSGASSVRFRAVMGAAEIVSMRDGMEAAVSNYLSIANQYIDEFPELARAAHVRAAEEYFRNDRLEDAINELVTIEAAYPGTEEAERVRHARRRWIDLAIEEAEARRRAGGSAGEVTDVESVRQE